VFVTMLPRARSFATIWAMLLLLGCGPADLRERLEDLPEPWFAVRRVDGECRGVVAVDGDGRVWAERQCDIEIDRVRPTSRLATPDERRRIERAFRALATTACGPEEASANFVALARRERQVIERHHGCFADGSWSGPWREAGAAFDALAPWPRATR
jgi:hypothetical protein